MIQLTNNFRIFNIYGLYFSFFQSSVLFSAQKAPLGPSKPSGKRHKNMGVCAPFI
jgi:hypothetical protein